MTSESSDKLIARPKARPRWGRRVAGLLVIVGACAGLACWGGCPNQAPTSDISPTTAPTTAPAADEDARMRKLVVGTWGDEYKGKRTMHLLADGTGTMHVELSGLNAILGSKMRFDMVWSVENGRLKKRTIGGQPSTRVSLILKAVGDRVDEPILELTDERMLLLDADGETKYDWRRAGGAAKNK